MMGILQHSDNPLSLPIWVVPKNSMHLEIVVDYRKLIEKQLWIGTLDIDSILSKLGECIYF